MKLSPKLLCLSFYVKLKSQVILFDYQLKSTCNLSLLIFRKSEWTATHLIIWSTESAQVSVP